VRLGPAVADLVLLSESVQPAERARPTSPMALLLASSGVAAILSAAAIWWIA
jgi:hypothetical protein